MNNERRKRIRSLIEKLSFDKELLEMISNEEEEAFDNMPEGIQESQMGENSQEAIELLGDALNSLDECIDSLDNIM
jgi:hypothetical protein